jgi:hypothetical protein
MKLKIVFMWRFRRPQLRNSCPVFRFLLLLVLSAVGVVPLAAQEAASNGVPAPEQSRRAEPQRIQDNSFLVEEAYNQEYGVVQHISAFTREFNTHSWIYTFTQEWPVPGQKHQLSYTLSLLNNRDAGTGAGLGDLAINYRYQAIGSGETRVAFAPRISLLAPSGSPRAGRGYGGYGLQTNLPLSVVVLPKLVTHWNAGATLVPHARNEAGQRATATGYNLGQSFIWLAHPRFNALLETTWTGSEAVVGAGRTQRQHDLLISPGIRWAHNFASGLQIVPGIGVPIGLGPSAGDKGIVLYLSFEHPLWGRKR